MAIGDNPNHTLQDRRDARDNMPAGHLANDATHLLAASCQQPLQIMAALFHAWGRGLNGMSEGFDEVRRGQYSDQQGQPRKTG